MVLTNDKKVSPNISRATWQELRIRQLLHTEGIFFKFQKVFLLTDRRYIVDFFLLDHIILECASTSMYKYQIPLRKKAIHLEAKSQQLKHYHPNFSIWVLLEAYRPILEPFSNTLVRLMPSVDQVFFSQQELREALQKFFFHLKNKYEVTNWQK